MQNYATNNQKKGKEKRRKKGTEKMNRNKIISIVYTKNGNPNIHTHKLQCWTSIAQQLVGAKSKFENTKSIRSWYTAGTEQTIYIYIYSMYRYFDLIRSKCLLLILMRIFTTIKTKHRPANDSFSSFCIL